MERYVYGLVIELCRLGHQVEVVCEEILCPLPPGVRVHQVPKSFSHPRWLSLLRFGQQVKRWLHNHPRPGWLIHSHERLAVHHITTYHGQPFATIWERCWLRLISLRVLMHLWLEEREISTATVVVPNSLLTRKQLLQYYPQFRSSIGKPILPGAECVCSRKDRDIPESGGVVVFVGKEWVRKGLAFAVDVVRELKKHRPDLKFLVIGPEPAEIKHLFADWQSGYELLGWVDSPDYSCVDVLIHPAKSEPYGMVVTEALTCNVRVVVSANCGVASEVRSDHGAVLTLDAPLHAWAHAMDDALLQPGPTAFQARDWHTVALEYQDTYQEVLQRMRQEEPLFAAPLMRRQSDARAL